jgi:hypothetical protein
MKDIKIQHNHLSPLKRANLNPLMTETEPASETLCVFKLTDENVQEYALLYMTAV